MIHDRTPEPEERRLLHELDNAEKRIRELETELLLANSKIQTMLELPPELQYRARAEKAEADLLSMSKTLIAEQARVAELSSAYDALVDDYNSLKRVTFAEREEC